MRIKICKTSDLNNNKSIRFVIPGERFDRDGVLIKNNNEIFAYYNECPHIGVTLDFDDNDFFSLDFTKLVCKNHGAEFTPDSGECTLGPCVGTFLRKINVVIEEETIFAKID